jgi:hypothetical protein
LALLPLRPYLSAQSAQAARRAGGTIKRPNAVPFNMHPIRQIRSHFFQPSGKLLMQTIELKTCSPQYVFPLPEYSVVLYSEPSRQFTIFGRSDSDVLYLPEQSDFDQIERMYPLAKTPVGHDPLSQFQASYSWLSICKKRGSINKNRTTYAFKHDIEGISDLYISEGSLIRAAILAGFTLAPASNDGGCFTNIAFDGHYCDMLASAEKLIGDLKPEPAKASFLHYAERT